jgi:hypothetical protein
MVVASNTKSVRAPPSNERPTLVPGFDVRQLARDSDRLVMRAAALDSGVHPIDAGQQVTDSSVHMRAADVYWRRIGGSEAIPRLLVPLDQVALEHRSHCEGFLLCRIDGVATLGEIIRDAELPELTAVCLACELFDAGIIAMTCGEGDDPAASKDAP